MQQLPHAHACAPRLKPAERIQEEQNSNLNFFPYCFRICCVPYNTDKPRPRQSAAPRPWLPWTPEAS
jgi:hypothetical protein